MQPPLQNPKFASDVNITKWRNVGWKTSTFFIQRLQTFFFIFLSRFFTFLTFFLNFFWNVFLTSMKLHKHVWSPIEQPWPRYNWLQNLGHIVQQRVYKTTSAGSKWFDVASDWRVGWNVTERYWPVVKVRGPGGGAQHPAPTWAPCNSMSPLDWIYKVLFYAQITPN